MYASAVGLALALGMGEDGAAQRGEPGEGNRGQGAGPAPGRGRANYSLSDPAPNDPALKGAIDMHAHQDPDSFGPSYGQAARSIDALDLYTRAKASGMRGFIIKGHLDQTAGLAYYMRKLHPDMEIFGGMGSNLTTGTKVNPWAITHMAEIKGGWGRIVWMPSWDSENSIHKLPRRPPAYVAVADARGCRSGSTIRSRVQRRRAAAGSQRGDCRSSPRRRRATATATWSSRRATTRRPK